MFNQLIIIKNQNILLWKAKLYTYELPTKVKRSGFVISGNHDLANPIPFIHFDVGNVRLIFFWRYAKNFVSGKFGFGAVIATNFHPVVWGNTKHDSGGVTVAVAGVEGDYSVSSLQ